MQDKGQVPCPFLKTAKGCLKAAACDYLHDEKSSPKPSAKPKPRAHAAQAEATGDAHQLEPCEPYVDACESDVLVTLLKGLEATRIPLTRIKGERENSVLSAKEADEVDRDQKDPAMTPKDEQLREANNTPNPSVELSSEGRAAQPCGGDEGESTRAVFGEFPTVSGESELNPKDDPTAVEVTTDSDYESCGEGDLVFMPERRPKVHSHVVRVKLADGTVIDDSTALDSAASHTFVGKHGCEEVENRQKLKVPVAVDTAGGDKEVTEVGDLHSEKEGLGIVGGLLMPWASLTLLSLREYMEAGWQIGGSGDTVTLEKGNEQVVFREHEGLYKPVIEPDFVPQAISDEDAFWVELEKTRKSLHKKKTAHASTVRHKPKRLSGALLSLMLIASVASMACGAAAGGNPMGSFGENENCGGQFDKMFDDIATGDVADTIREKVRRKRKGKGADGEAEVDERRETEAADAGVLEHRRRGHLPHDPNCLTCAEARMTAKRNTRNADPRKIDGADEGYVLSVDQFGPFLPDVDGNTNALIANEVAHTDWGFIELMTSKAAPSCLKSLQEMVRDVEGTGDMKVVRVHADDDPSFQAEFERWLLDQKVRHTHVGGYRPQNNSRVERRIRMATETYRANRMVATGGIKEYDSLWGPGLKHAMWATNVNQWKDGRCPHEARYGEPYKLNPKQDHVFGAQARFHTVKEHRESKWDNPGNRGIWVGRSKEVRDGHVVVPLEWNAGRGMYDLGKCVHVSTVVVDDEVFPLRMGPRGVEMRQEGEEVLGELAGCDEVTKAMHKYCESMLLPEYERVKGVVGDRENGLTVDPKDGGTWNEGPGVDPIYYVNRIAGHTGTVKRRHYEVLWEDGKSTICKPNDLLNYGAADLVKEYEAELKAAQKGKASKLAAERKAALPVKKRGRPKGSKNKPKANTAKVTSLPCDECASETDRRAVQELIRKQGVGGTCDEWLPGYMKELKFIRELRMRPLEGQELKDVHVGRTAVKLRMILEPKRDGRKKGRLVMQGFREPLEWDNGPTDSPVATMAAIRTLLFKANWWRNVGQEEVISMVDIDVAFLQCPDYPEGAVKRYVKYKPHAGADWEYAGLRGPIYGQRSASREFFNTISKYLVGKGFKQGSNEPCVFKNKATGMVVACYVDDIIARGPRKATEDFYKELGNKELGGFKMKQHVILEDEGKFVFLGFEMGVRMEGGRKVYYMGQQSSMQEFLEEAGAKPVRGVHCPMPDAKTINQSTRMLDGPNADAYRKQVGALNYYAMTTRYDIAYPTSKLSQYSDSPTEGANAALKRVLGYLRTTVEFELRGERRLKDEVKYYSDSDHAADKRDGLVLTNIGNADADAMEKEKVSKRRSQTGMVIMLNDVPVYWQSKKQQAIAYSSAAAEIYALSETMKSSRLFMWRCQEMGMKLPKVIDVQVDSKGARSFQLGAYLESKLRGCFDLRESWVQEFRNQGIMTTTHVDGKDNLADLFTKGLAAKRFKYLIKKHSQHGEGLVSYYTNVQALTFIED